MMTVAQRLDYRSAGATRYRKPLIYSNGNGELVLWVYDRLVNVHGERTDADYMRELRKFGDDLIGKPKLSSNFIRDGIDLAEMNFLHESG